MFEFEVGWHVLTNVKLFPHRKTSQLCTRDTYQKHNPLATSQVKNCPKKFWLFLQSRRHCRCLCRRQSCCYGNLQPLSRRQSLIQVSQRPVSRQKASPHSHTPISIFTSSRQRRFTRVKAKNKGYNVKAITDRPTGNRSIDRLQPDFALNCNLLFCCLLPSAVWA